MVSHPSTGLLDSSGQAEDAGEGQEKEVVPKAR